MDQFKSEEDPKLSGPNIQGLDFTNLLLQDYDAFENFFFPPESMNYNPNYQDANQYFDIDELNEMKDEENSDEGGNGGGHGSNMVPVQRNNDVVMEERYEILNEQNSGEGGNGGGHGGDMVPVQMNNGVVMEAKLKNEGHAKDYVKRKRYKKGSIEAARMMELKKIRNRETAARAFEQKKAYLEQLELSVKEFKKENAYLKNLLLFEIISLSSGRAEKQLRRTASGPL